MKNPFDLKTAWASAAYEHWVRQGNPIMADRMFAVWQRMAEKRLEWENAAAQVRCEILDAVAAYERRVGLR